MKRSLLTAVGIMVLALAVPSAALAHHGRRHHHHHHHKVRAKGHHAKFRIVHVGSPSGTPGSPPATPPATPPTPENAGTVASYTGGVLTLTLNDGSTVSGKVTSRTRIRCVKAAPAPPPAGTEGLSANRGFGDDKGHGDDWSRDQQSDHGPSGWWHGDHGDDDDGEDPHASEPPCDSSALVAGAVVRAAELRIGLGGAEFESVWLVR